MNFQQRVGSSIIARLVGKVEEKRAEGSGGKEKMCIKNYEDVWRGVKTKKYQKLRILLRL